MTEADAACYMCQLNTSSMKKQVGCIEVLGKDSSTKGIRIALSARASALAKYSLL